jgi:bifunctional UDP-N-acetylglucosamine pyrophosphorylase/glucosamine-1-phosphate N-acetyltransferase
MGHDHKHNFAAIILAAGKGTRMRSNLPKVMHKVAGKPMIAQVLLALSPLKPLKTVVVLAPHMEEVKAVILKEMPDAAVAIQTEQLGTGHAVRCAEKELAGFDGTVIILYGDTPLITSNTLHALVHHCEDADITVLGMRPQNPTGYGRMLVDGNRLLKVVEEKDASAEEKKITLCNSGVVAVKTRLLFSLLAEVKTNNKANEYYLTDIITIAGSRNLRCLAIEAEASEMAGINDRNQLSGAERAMQERLQQKAMEQGATLVDPATIYLSNDTKLGQDVIVHPCVFFGPGVTVEDGVEIRSFSHIESAYIKKGSVIGPFARLRPGTTIGEEAHVGNFVELKNASIGKGAKANHLSYIGDSEVGEGANIGAGTITCNYDGTHKYKTTIGAGAFIGSNTALVAPVTVGDFAIVGAGSVITKDVEEGALAITRPEQVNKPGKAKELRQRKKKTC